MIRTIELVCSECGQDFLPQGKLYYRDNYTAYSLRDTKFICDSCIAAWKKKWQIKEATFQEHDYVLTVNIHLEDGSVYNNMDCTPIEETATVVTGEDIPVEAQQVLYKLYEAWDLERKAHLLKQCSFNDEFMRTTFTCETYGGEKYENVAFRFNMRGELQTEIPLPDYIKEQLTEAYGLYEAQNSQE